MAIKEIPTNFRVYYKSMRDTIKPKYEDAVEEYDKKRIEEKALYDEIKLRADYYKTNYNFNVYDYEEFSNNTYKLGLFYNAAKNLFLNRKQKYIADSSSYDVYKLARKQKELHSLEADINKYKAMLDLSLKDYCEVLRSFYNEVHKAMIINGYGYAFENPLGWICINRCKIVNGKRKRLNFDATRKNKEKLISEGKRLWNKDEADYARLVGADYDGVDYRVYMNEEICYEIPLIGCRVSTTDKYRLTTNFSRRYTKGKTNKDLIEECSGDLNKICELPVDIRLKLALCLEVDDILYLNFIRNEAQQSAKTPEANRKNRQ